MYQLGLAQAKPGQASARLWLAPGSGLSFWKPQAMAWATALGGNLCICFLGDLIL